MQTTSRSYVAIILLALLFGCTTIRPASIPDHMLAPPLVFSHDDFDRVLQRYVDDQGLVDYARLKDDPEDIDRYYLLLSTYSPDSHPSLFPTEQSKLAYWINAYNAAVIKTVLNYYPISSVEDVEPPKALFFFPDKSGFFLFQRLTFGGETTSLYYLENGVIRKRFRDPRIHFAINCAARGCPRLPRRPFTAQHLNDQLDRETRKFLSEERNLRVDHQEKTIYLSSIFDWYESDFLDWYMGRYPEQEATLPNYVALYLSEKESTELRRNAGSYEVRFIPYDWRLNDKNGATSVRR